MTNPAGTAFATAVLRYLRSRKVGAEKLTQAGSNDEGDMAVVIAGKTYVFELKATKKIDLPGFWREAELEAQNYAKARGLEVVPPAYAVVKRRNAGIDKSWVVQSLESWLAEKGVARLDITD